MGRKLLIVAAIACAAIAPALAFSQGPSIAAFDDYWLASPGGGTDVTVTKPANGDVTVEFSYPKATGQSVHTLVWKKSGGPSCPGVPTGQDFRNGRPGWKGTCTFHDVGTYDFVCGIHDTMTGSVKVVAPAATQSPTPSPSPSPSPEPGSNTTTQPATNTNTTQQPSSTGVTPLDAKVATSQKGTAVRGTLSIAERASRLEITVAVNKRRVGSYVRNSAANGPREFTIPLDARARKELKRKRSLTVTVSIAVTPRGGARAQQTFNVRLRG